ncbi:glycosyltransferase family 4 protein [Litoreibacter roseus]|uniref:Glycosyl transferase n=1 Tax=Litoreibacter roseus TaxID=2601869 RepID=A0A6N6JED9_9RHOB|nr:glycosyltransferase family 1 protein [Litoreibacter roseus]GFE64576.1 glycosyl transferase [Litoreibacter roseus]
MPGVGTRRDITINRHFPVLLDISRLISRVHLPQMTGIDRVEMAYLDWGMSSDAPFHAVVRLVDSVAVLDRQGVHQILDRLMGRVEWGTKDLRAFAGLKLPDLRRRAEADVRRIAVAKIKEDQVGDIALGDAIYLNVGHFIQSRKFLLSFSGLKVHLVHDLIPLDYPQFQKSGTVPKFEADMRRVAAVSDLILSNSKATADRVAEVFGSWGSVAPVSVAHLGVSFPHFERKATISKAPYFIAIGTIEPRKNYDFLLDLWEELAGDPDRWPPHLHIVGRDGWADKALFRRLKVAETKGWLSIHSDIDDAQLWSLLSGSGGLLFPSHAEGFGLPGLEAKALGIPVICPELDVHKELLGDYPVYASTTDRYQWITAIQRLVDRSKTRSDIQSDGRLNDVPIWSDHFRTITAEIEKLR